MSRIIGNLKPHGDTGTVLFAAAYLEHALENLLLSRFVKLGKEDTKRLFDASAGGILGSFNAKIRVAHAMGLYGDIVKHDLGLINDIRNVFAHSLHKIDFEDEYVAKDCKSLRISSTIRLETVDGSEVITTGPYDIFVRTTIVIYQVLRFWKGERDMIVESKPSLISPSRCI